MLRKSQTSPKLFSDSNTLSFAGITALVVFVVLVFFMTATTPHHGLSADLPTVLHSVSMPGVLREGAMIVNITRDGAVYFGSDQIALSDLPGKIRERLTDRGVERKVYVRADARVRWGTVRPALDGVQSAGIIRVAFLGDQRSLSAP